MQHAFHLDDEHLGEVATAIQARIEQLHQTQATPGLPFQADQAAASIRRLKEAQAMLLTSWRAPFPGTQVDQVQPGPSLPGQ